MVQRHFLHQLSREAGWLRYILLSSWLLFYYTLVQIGSFYAERPRSSRREERRVRMLGIWSIRIMYLSKGTPLHSSLHRRNWLRYVSIDIRCWLIHVIRNLNQDGHAPNYRWRTVQCLGWEICHRNGLWTTEWAIKREPRRVGRTENLMTWSESPFAMAYLWWRQL